MSADSLTPTQKKRAINFNNKHAWDLLPALRAAFALPPATPGALDSYDLSVIDGLCMFQEERKLGADGLIGRGTRPVVEKAFATFLYNDARPLWPARRARPKDRFAHYIDLCALYGHTLGDTPTLIGLRGVKLLAPRTHQTRSDSGSYDDAFVLLLSDGRLREFRGSTHPFQKTGTESTPDFDGDGEPDVGMIRPGIYHAERDWFQDRKALRLSAVGSGHRIPTWRDMDQDGVFSPAEKAQSEQTGQHSLARQQDAHIGAYATNILFHEGSGLGSIGCQTSTQPNIDVLHDNAPLEYLLIEATEAIERIQKREMLRANELNV